jgi:hypothetical protein
MKKFTKLKVFDFDGTLVDTPLPEFGKQYYKKKTGQDWPHAGWWGQPMSLDMTVFEMPLIESVITDYKKEISDSENLVVMLTGRMVKLTDMVKTILDDSGLTFHEYHFNRGGSTEVAKVKTMETILHQHPFIKEIVMWDDRLSHIPVFRQWGDDLVESGRLDKFDIVIVPADRH